MHTQTSIHGGYEHTLTREALISQLDRRLGSGADAADTDRDDMHMYKGGSDQWFVTYELGPYPEEDPGDDGSCPQVTRVYLSGDLRHWELGTFTTRSGASVYGVKIEYERTHDCHHARSEADEPKPHCSALRHGSELGPGSALGPGRAPGPNPAPGQNPGSSGCFVKIIELPPGATDIEVRAALPDRYRHALHRL
jgi:hypothetical protein